MSPGPSDFATTQWSMVVAAGRRSSPAAEAALADLCRRYWYPLHVYVLRRVPDVHEARDLTQEFFAHLLEKNTLAKANPERGRFRSFLLTALKHFLGNEWDKAKTQKRGGDRKHLPLDFDSRDAHVSFEPAHDLTPERLFERQWALTLLDRVLGQLRDEYVAAEKSRLFDHLKSFLIGKSATADHAQTAETLGMSVGAVKVAAHRLRRRYREILRHEVAQTVSTDSEIDDEIRALFRSLAE